MPQRGQGRLNRLKSGHVGPEGLEARGALFHRRQTRPLPPGEVLCSLHSGECARGWPHQDQAGLHPQGSRCDSLAPCKRASSSSPLINRPVLAGSEGKSSPGNKTWM